MKNLHITLLACVILTSFLVACDEATPETLATPLPYNETPSPFPTASQAYCNNNSAATPLPNSALAAKVNGQPISLTLFQRQSDQNKAALVAQGLDSNSSQGQETLKGLPQQVLGQLIDDVLVEQAAKAANVSVSAQDVNNRIEQMINDAGGQDKFGAWLTGTQTTLDDLCFQIRASAYGEAMLDHVTADMPTKVEQVHAAHIMLSSQADADKVVAELKAKKEFAALAKQYSTEEATRDNGGDLGWFPRGVMPAEFDAAAFSLQAGQVSGVVSTPPDFQIIQVLDHAQSRELSSDMLQYQKQQAFLAWLDAQRNKAQIEKFVNP